jgi:hypothetical protein
MHKNLLQLVSDISSYSNFLNEEYVNQKLENSPNDPDRKHLDDTDIEYLNQVLGAYKEKVNTSNTDISSLIAKETPKLISNYQDELNKRRLVIWLLTEGVLKTGSSFNNSFIDAEKLITALKKHKLSDYQRGSAETIYTWADEQAKKFASIPLTK